MENRCKRCNRKLSNPNDDYGWRCAEILGIDSAADNFSEDYRTAFNTSIEKAGKMLKNSTLDLTKENANAFFVSLFKQYFSKLIGRYDLELKAKKEGFQILTNGKKYFDNKSFNNWISNLNTKESSLQRSIEFGASNPSAAMEIGYINKHLKNISSNSDRFATRIFESLSTKSSNISRQTNAFRHVLWQATITKRYGINVAREVGFAHEENPIAIGDKYTPEDFKYIEFRGSAAADEACDLLNNIQGRIIGITTKNDDIKKIAPEVLEKYYSNGFWESKQTSNRTYRIELKKLSQLQYEDAKNQLRSLDDNGFRKEN